MKKILSLILGSLLVSVVAGILYYLLCLNHVSLNEAGLFYDSRNGELVVQTNAGWYKTSPFVSEIDISTLPFKVYPGSYISSTVINEKVVRFNPAGAEALIKLVGFSHYTSYTGYFGAYAYSGQKWPFLEILQEINPTPLSVTNK